VPLTGVVVAGLVVFVLFRPRPLHDPVDRTRADLVEALPVGTDYDAVAAWARQAGVPCNRRTGLWPGSPTMEELAGLTPAEAGSYVELVVPCGSYRVWRDGSVAANHMWVFLPLDAAGRVRGHHFLTLAELAEHERQRDANRRPD
jgi:hypothetical protein